MPFPMVVNPPNAGKAADAAMGRPIKVGTGNMSAPGHGFQNYDCTTMRAGTQIVSDNFVGCLALVVHDSSTGRGFLAHIDITQAKKPTTLRHLLNYHGFLQAAPGGGKVRDSLIGIAVDEPDQETLDAMTGMLRIFGDVQEERQTSGIMVTTRAGGVTVEVFTG